MYISLIHDMQKSFTHSFYKSLSNYVFACPRSIKYSIDRKTNENFIILPAPYVLLIKLVHVEYIQASVIACFTSVGATM